MSSLELFWQSRCETCEHYHATVFKEESQSGLGVWEGYCVIQPSKKYGWMSCKQVLNVYHKCEYYQKKVKGE